MCFRETALYGNIILKNGLVSTESGLENTTRSASVEPRKDTAEIAA